MKHEKEGYMIVSECHPMKDYPVIREDTFHETPDCAIDRFCNGSRIEWHAWQNNFGYEVKQVKVTIEIK